MQLNRPKIKRLDEKVKISKSQVKVAQKSSKNCPKQRKMAKI